MKNPMAILRRPGMPESLKISTFSSELRRRLRTTSPYLSQATNEEIILDLMDDMGAMGYAPDLREKVLKATMVGWLTCWGG